MAQKYCNVAQLYVIVDMKCMPRGERRSPKCVMMTRRTSRCLSGLVPHSKFCCQQSRSLLLTTEHSRIYYSNQYPKHESSCQQSRAPRLTSRRRHMHQFDRLRPTDCSSEPIIVFPIQISGYGYWICVLAIFHQDWDSDIDGLPCCGLHSLWVPILAGCKSRSITQLATSIGPQVILHESLCRGRLTVVQLLSRKIWPLCSVC